MEFLCLDFINSDWRDYRGSGQREDRLLNQDWLKSMLANWQLTYAAPPDSGELAQLTELRDLLRHSVEAIVASKELDPNELAKLNGFLNFVPLQRSIKLESGFYQLEVKPEGSGWERVIVEVAVSFAELLTRHEPSLIKICENPDCGWVFYDGSKNHSQRWCDAKLCGNMIKVRRFRERQASAEIS